VTHFRTIKEIIILSTAILYSHLVSFAQSGNPDLNAADRLKNYFATYSPEKAYLQFDKPYYAAGDTIYFKAYVTEGERHQLSGLNEVLHVDLINPENKIDQSIQLLLNNGIIWGDFALPDSLPAGNYRVRAYTRWMRNRGELDFFDRIIPVGSLINSHTARREMQRLQEINSKDDIQFFPEGGSLVIGIRSKVAFKAIASNGLGINVKGIIIDSANKKVGSFASTNMGIGYFFLKPQEGKTYHAKVNFGDSSENIVDLPKPELSGITLSVNNDSILKASVRIEANTAYYQANQNKDFILFIYSGGIAVTVNCKLDTSVINLGIIKRLLHSGVTRITLFSPEGEPLCEHLLFVKNDDQLRLQIDSGKTVYSKREKVALMLNARNKLDSTVAGHFSVSVTDESKVSEDENNERTILTDLLLSSELKGYVEQPNYYFKDTSEEAKNNLDILMLTQGYRSFEWKQVLDMNTTPLVYQPEEGLEINGRITNQFGKPISNGTVTLIPSNGGPVLSRVSNDKGLFKFTQLIFADTTHFVLSAVNSKGKNSTEITYFTDKDQPPILAKPKMDSSIFNDTGLIVYLENTKKIRVDITRNDTSRYKLLKEVKVKAQNPNTSYRTQSLAGAGNADQVMHAAQIEQIGGQLGTSLNGRLIGIQFRHYMGMGDFPYLVSPPGDGPMVVVIDGVVTNAFNGNGTPAPVDIDVIPSSQVETIEVLKYASASIYGMGGGNGVLVITTKRGDENEDHSTPNGILSIAAAGFYKARTFYSPKYNPQDINSPRPDLRSTIYWNPEIQTSKDGKATFDYYNADGTGTYKVTIEGIDTNGNIGRMVYRYKVE
jgi:TonB-dependent SusC/RagA subfamily outer membrane receptor